MAKTHFFIECKKTGNTETWEDIVLDDVRGGKGNQLLNVPHLKNCMNIQCDFRGTELCPHDERFPKKPTS
jgi:hypothetical protein